MQLDLDGYSVDKSLLDLSLYYPYIFIFILYKGAIAFI